MMFKNRKEGANWIFTLVYIFMLTSRLFKWDFSMSGSRWGLSAALLTLIGVHAYAAVMHRKKGSENLRE